MIGTLIAWVALPLLAIGGAAVAVDYMSPEQRRIRRDRRRRLRFGLSVRP